MAILKRCYLEYTLTEMTAGEFKSILLPCYRRMYATAFAILRNPDDASDAVQDTVSHLWQKHPELKVPDNAEAFCISATRNTCIDRLRTVTKRYSEATDEILNIGSSISSDGRASYDSTKAYIRRVLEGFPDKQRRVLMLSFISQLTNEEICEVTGETPPNVRQILSRGRKKLKECLSNESKS